MLLQENNLISFLKQNILKCFIPLTVYHDNSPTLTVIHKCQAFLVVAGLYHSIFSIHRCWVIFYSSISEKCLHKQHHHLTEKRYIALEPARYSMTRCCPLLVSFIITCLATTFTSKRGQWRPNTVRACLTNIWEQCLLGSGSGFHSTLENTHTHVEVKALKWTRSVVTVSYGTRLHDESLSKCQEFHYMTGR